jgi:alpha-L-rhamnosidase
LEGRCRVSGLYLREYADPDCWQAQFACSDERLNRIFAAGRETFRQNAVDIFMDCPSRERAGWLCDSFYTARVARDLSGNTKIERNFLENYALPPRFEFLPNGCLPMCYPADHNDAIFIPNWTMWFVLQLEEYLARTGDRVLVDALKPKVLNLLTFLKSFRNSDGLLEKLPSWVFVEWSKANDFVQDVNFPSNMLFARVLEASGRIYAMPALVEEAEQLRATIRRQSFDGAYFVDNARRIDGKLVVTTNRTETCQYYAFYFGTVTIQSHPELWNTLVKDFGAQRRETRAHPEIHPPNMLPGLNMRMELLARNGLTTEFLNEMSRVLLPMAEQTGTLWENDTPSASCNHGFASHVTHLLYASALGVQNIDTVQKTVRIRFSPGPLAWCEGLLPVPEGKVSLRWRKAGARLEYQLQLPAGYSAQVDAEKGLAVERKF